MPENNKHLDWDLVYGALTFGLGWGISGMCPGPAMVQMGVGFPKVGLAYMPALACGMLCAHHVKKWANEYGSSSGSGVAMAAPDESTKLTGA